MSRSKMTVWASDQQRPHAASAGVLAALAALVTLVSCEPTLLLTEVEHRVDVASLETAAMPVIFPASGPYTSDQLITMNAATSGATIHYTTDGSVPTASSPVYSEPIPMYTIGHRITVSAIAVATGMNASATASTEYEALFALFSAGPAGGIVVYDHGDDTAGWRYIEAAPYDQGSAVVWDESVSPAATGATATAAGSGRENTATIVVALGSGNYAAGLCDGLVQGGFDDWFLPAKDVVDIMNTNRDTIGGFTTGTGTYYWSSSEAAATTAWVYEFKSGGGEHTGTKSISYHVRAVRSF